MVVLMVPGGWLSCLQSVARGLLSSLVRRESSGGCLPSGMRLNDTDIDSHSGRPFSTRAIRKCLTAGLSVSARTSPVQGGVGTPW